MPKIDIDTIAERRGADYPAPFAAPCAERIRQRLGDAGGLVDFGVNLMRLAPGAWSSQRHWHAQEDEFVYVLAGHVTLIDDQGETVLGPNECAAFPKGAVNGHHLVNWSSEPAILLEIGSRSSADIRTYPDIDLKFENGDDCYSHKDGTPYP
jgi:uncharacterized cupin superfamily protein